MRRVKDYFDTAQEALMYAPRLIEQKQDNQRVLIVKIQSSGVYLAGMLRKDEELRHDARIIAEY